MSDLPTEKLPSGWCWVKLHQVADAITGNTPPTSDAGNYGGCIPFIKPPQLVDAGLWRAPETLTDDGARRARLLPVGAVLVSCIGNLGKTAIAKVPCATNQQINALVFDHGVSPEYGWYYAQTLQPWLTSVASATTVSIVNKGKFETAPFPLAPTQEQAHIVEKLEELLPDLDDGVAELKAAQRKLAQYRQSLLKAAVEGTLTANWRAMRAGEPQETAAELLQRILTERRARWEAKQLAKYAEQGKVPPSGWRAKYVDPVLAAADDLPQLPEGWTWATVNQLISTIETGKSFKCEERPPHSHEVGVVKVSAVSWGEYDENESKTCLDDERINEELLVRPGDFLFSRANTIELVGACVVAKSVNLRIMLSDKILRFDLVDGRLKEWLLAFLRSEHGRKQIERLASGNQDSMRNIGQERIKQIAVPLPPMLEVEFARELLEQSVMSAESQETAIGLGLKQAAAQRKNILKAAFAGQLVPQDPNDEPAGVLVERIRAQRAARGTSGNTRGRTARKTA